MRDLLRELSLLGRLLLLLLHLNVIVAILALLEYVGARVHRLGRLRVMHKVSLVDHMLLLQMRGGIEVNLWLSGCLNWLLLLLAGLC